MSNDLTARSHHAGPGGAHREIRSLTGLRIVAALWVVCYHFTSAPGDAYTRYWQPLAPVLRHGSLGVDLFFVLSGFVITLTHLDQLGPRTSVRAAGRFWWARICRIWPVHALVTTVFGGWLLYKSTRVTDGNIAYQFVQPVVDPLHWLEQMLMVQLWHRPYFDGSSWSGPAWSISAEWLAYAAFPVLALGLWRLRNAPPAVTGVLAVGCMVPFGYLALAEGGADFPYAWLLRIGGGFLAGAFTCLTVRRLPVGERTDRVATRVAALATVELLVCLWWGHTRDAAQSGVAAVVFPVLVGALALSTRGISRWLATEPMVVGGRISFALYLVHVPVFEVLYTAMTWYPGLLGPGTTLGTLLLPHVLMGTVVLAWLVHRYVEEPARRRLRGVRLPLRRSHRAPAAVPSRWVLPRHGTASASTRPPAPAVRRGRPVPAPDASALPLPRRRAVPAPGGGTDDATRSYQAVGPA
ncbi:acyltransferase family protein [Geodermatophilus sp. SYSU D00697]